MRIECDINKCSGCLACVTICLDHHYEKDAEGAVSGRLYKKKIFENGLTQYVTESCRHCKNAPCMKACPVGAISQNEEGWVIVDKETCIGCQACAAACPFNIPRYDGAGKMTKCDGCGACVINCPNGALSIVK